MIENPSMKDSSWNQINLKTLPVQAMNIFQGPWNVLL